MRNILIHCLIILTLIVLFPIDLTAQNIIEITDRYGSTPVKGGEYTVKNNVWGASTAQTLEIDLSGTYFKVILSEHNNTGGIPAAYPFIYKGYHWGGGTGAQYNPFPILVGELDTAPFTWSIDTSGVKGTWNAAFEAFFSLNGASAPDGGGELMIWINYGGGKGPAGSKVATVEIGGNTWDVYYQPYSPPDWKWSYTAYKITVVTDSINVDLKDFIHDALTRGYLYTSWYLDNMEAGFEIWSNGQGLTTYSYSATAIGGGSEENYAPTPFILMSPSNNTTLKSMAITFKWQKSVDANLDPIEYIFHLNGPGIDTTISGIDTVTQFFDGSNFLQPDTLYTWYIEATDGIDTTESTTRRTLRTPKASGVDLVDQIPNRFILDQNHPNPFNPLTTISYSLPQISTVTLKIYDVMGREMATLVNNERRTVGNHKVLFDATDLPSGVYLYRLQTENYIETKKMILIK